MVRLARWILGYVKFVFFGGFIDGFVDMSFENKVNIKNLKVKKGKLYGECLAREYIKLHSIAFRNGGRVKVIKKSGLVFPLLKLRNRWGLFAGALIFVCFICFISGFIWNVEITGNERISEEQIVSFLESNNLYRGAPWRKIDKDRIENLMMASFDDCAWAHINELGTTARIEISETKQKPEVINKNMITNVKAKKDGLIVKTSVTNGWQTAKIGDSVVKGDLLISGIYESEKKKGNQFAHASGEFIAKVNEPFSLTVSRKQSYREYKEERAFKKLVFFSVEIPLYLSSYENKNAEIKESGEYLKLNNNELPIGLITVKEKRYTVKTRELSDSELQSLTEKEIQNKIENEFSDCEIIKKNLSIQLNESNAIVKGELICLEDIAEEVEIKIKNK